MKTLLSLLLVLLFTLEISAQNSNREISSYVPDQVKKNEFVSAYTIDNCLSFKAKFNKHNFDIIKHFLINELGDYIFQVDRKTYIWVKESEGFHCTLSKKGLILNINHTLASQLLSEKVDTILSNFKYYTPL